MSSKALMVVALTSLCFLAMATVHIRNREALLGYRIAELEREKQRRCDHIMTLRSDVAGRTALPALMRRAAALNIALNLDGLEGALIELIPPAGDGPVGPAADGNAGTGGRRRFVE